MAKVLIENVTKSFGAVEVIRGVSVDIEDGQFVALVGPSGCGKSTLLRMIAGLEEITGGVIQIGDRVVNDLPPKERNIAMVFQSYALYPHMTVASNMAFSLDLAKVDKAERDRKVNAAAEMLGLTPLLERYPRQLSGGQRQRVAMGRALVRAPAVFLFDEPLSNLDAKLRVQMRAELKELHQRVRTTTVYVTHDQVEAMTMADKIVVMRDGVIEQVGSPLELYDEPANLFVAGFIGSPSMNFIAGRMGDGGFMSDDGVLLAGLVAPGNAITFGIRPDHIQLGGDVQFKVSVVEPMGSETVVIGKLGGNQMMAVFRERVVIEPGDTIGVTLKYGQGHFFDADGRRILPSKVN
jgi:multiple sugar transport system ATP-binding protein